MSDLSRKFNAGRQSELLYNEELATVFESIKHLLEVPAGKDTIPHPKLHGSFWWDRARNELNYYDKAHDKMINVFKPKFQLIDQMLSLLPPTDPVYGQIWLNNGVLYYFDGVNWSPIKALNVDSSQLNMSAFEDFILLSPLIKTGNTVIENDYDKALENYERAVLESKLDIDNDAKLAEVDNYAIGDKLFRTELELPLIPEDAKTQFLVVNSNVDRLFVNNSLSLDYDVVNSICVQYTKRDIVGKRNSLVHVNPGKITSIEKRILKIDRLNPTFYMSTQNTEFYGYKKDDKLGRFLKPIKSTDDDDNYGDFSYVEGGINLSYNASQDFDYILAITYKFSWIKSSGHLKKTTSDDKVTSYYIPKATTPLNVFVDGYDLENTYWRYDGLSQVVSIKEDTRNNEVSLWETLKNEYGWIKQYTIDNRGIIKTITSFMEPLIFVNGEAFAPTSTDVEINGKEIYVSGAKRDMCWGVVELYDEDKKESIFAKSGYVNELYGGNNAIYYDGNKILDGYGIILFVNGLLVKSEDINRNTVTKFITVNGLKQNDEYIILIDKDNNMLAEKDLSAAMYVGRNDESLVYMNGSLLCNSTAIMTTSTENETKLKAANNEIKAFVKVVGSSVVVKYCIYDFANEVWTPLSSEDIAAMHAICFSYDNTTSAIKINFSYAQEDQFTVFAYSFANTVEHPLIIRNTWAHDESEFTVDTPFESGTGALSVWLDGIRQYHLLEYKDGTGFSLPEKVIGKITYIIEKAETGKEKACEREILTYENIIGDTSNVYKTEMSLYPGRVTVYVSGLRVPKSSWTILDNNTLMFKDTTKKLIGNSETFPELMMKRADGEIIKIPITLPDEILVEVRQEFKRVEQSIEWSDPDETEINVENKELPPGILEAADEILIFINGTYTGLTNNSGYYKDRAKGCVTFLASSAISFLNLDPLFNALAADQEKRLAYETKYGKQYERKINNLITLEWR